MAKRSDEPKSTKIEQGREQAERAARFARAIARTELGRSYWSERSERALREALARKPKRR